MYCSNCMVNTQSRKSDKATQLILLLPWHHIRTMNTTIQAYRFLVGTWGICEEILLFYLIQVWCFKAKVTSVDVKTRLQVQNSCVVCVEPHSREITSDMLHLILFVLLILIWTLLIRNIYCILRHLQVYSSCFESCHNSSYKNWQNIDVFILLETLPLMIRKLMIVLFIWNLTPKPDELVSTAKLVHVNFKCVSLLNAMVWDLVFVFVQPASIESQSN